jgi:23S rRNA-/tRNA-specific pseudouridylate synthase
VRLAKYLAHAGVASRRASEQLVFAGRVSVGDEVVRDPARDVDGSVPVTVDGKPVRVSGGQRAVYAVNKPRGVVSTARDPQGRPTVVSLVPSARRLYPVGRLDADTTGLILLTDDGALAHRLTHPSFEVPRTYHAKVRRAPVKEDALQALRRRRARRRPHRPGAGQAAGGRPRRDHHPRGPQAPGAADARGRRPSRDLARARALRAAVARQARGGQAPAPDGRGDREAKVRRR